MTLEGSEPGVVNDRVTIGTSTSNKDVLEMLVSQGHFNNQLSAFQSAAMLAIRIGLDPESAPASAGTMWNRGSVRPQVLDFLSWYFESDTPARLLESYGNAGLQYISGKVKAGGYSFSEIFELSDSG